jgi:hypothetical protein
MQKINQQVTAAITYNNGLQSQVGCRQVGLAAMESYEYFYN